MPIGLPETTAREESWPRISVGNNTLDINVAITPRAPQFDENEPSRTETGVSKKIYSIEGCTCQHTEVDQT
jgi:hypothetical protein